MGSYLVLARKYRSTTFDEVVGQEPISRTLTNAIKTGRVAHAYLFSGTRGVGKTTMARILAKALNCQAVEEPTPTPCNKCDACIAIARGDDIDVIEIDGASNRGIDEIRELRANAIFSPSRSRFKIYYIDEVHMLTKEAFNALLKTLEEPPSHVKFIFATTEPQKLPATILSRCQRFDFRNIPTRMIAEHLGNICKLEDVDADADALFRIARAAAGSMRDGLSLLDQLFAGRSGKVTDEQVVAVLGVPSDERTLGIAAAIADGNASEALTQLDGVLEGGVTLTTVATALGDVFRNMMIASACGGKSDLIELPDTQKQAVVELAGRFSAPALVQAVGLCQTAAFKVRTSSLARAFLEAVIVRLAEADKFVDPESLIERLEALGSAAGSTGVSSLRDVSPVAPGGVPSLRDVPPVGGARTGSPPSGPSAPQSETPAIPIQWDVSWLRSNWPVVIEHLMARRAMRLAGLIRTARPLAFDGGVLRLSFDAEHESLRQQCAGSMVDSINSALTALAGQAVRCEFISDGRPDNANGAAQGRAFGGLSTAEKTEIVKDPAVREVLTLFGGEVADIRKDQPRSDDQEQDAPSDE